MFPEPKLENVYKAWKPIDYGHPLVDVTIHYAPPELERVHIGEKYINQFKVSVFSFETLFLVLNPITLSISN